MPKQERAPPQPSANTVLFHSLVAAVGLFWGVRRRKADSPLAGSPNPNAAIDD
jgi:hypothetical protein